MATAATVPNIYQFKITIKTSKPKTWRRIQVPEEYNFWELHVAITSAMGWLDCHLHQFKMINPNTGNKVIIGKPDDNLFADRICERTAKIAQYFLSPKIKANYEYDFGDGWDHEVILEKILPATVGMKYPQCIKGKMACPPENCGGILGYQELVKTLANPQDPRYEECMEELEFGGNEGFDPVKFDPKEVIFSDPEERWRMAL